MAMTVGTGATSPVTTAPRPVTLAMRRPPAPKPAPLGKDHVERQVAVGAEPLHLVFVSDIHSNEKMMAKFIKEVNAQAPDLVIDGGDRVHEGLEVEFIRSEKALKQVKAPFYEVEGNHDAKPQGVFHAPKPTPPELQSFDKQGVHFILIDNSSETLTDAQFQLLETDLKANKGKTTIVAMHVPPLLKNKPAMIRISEALPGGMAGSTMHDDKDVERFTKLMSRYKVSAVLAGHAHYPDYTEQGGVKYIVAGAAGGMTPGMGIDHEYLDIHVTGRVVDVKRVTLEKAHNNPVSFAYDVMRFTADLNAINHAEGGWNYVPRGSVQLRAGQRYTTTDHGSSIATSATVSIETARANGGKRGPTADITVAGGPDELSAEIAAGYKYRPIGDFTSNLYVVGGVSANGGIIARAATAGVGARAAVGGEYKHLTLEVGHEIATNRNMSYATVGYRF